jgi:hypothetical protein
VGDLTDVIRIASRRPLKDAAFFAAFNIRIGRIEETVLDVLKSSHREASDVELNEAIAASNVLEACCLAIPRHRLNDRDKALSVLQEAKDDHPGFMPETYLLMEGYIRAGGENVAQAEQFGRKKNSVSSPDWADTLPEQLGIDSKTAAILQWIYAALAAIFLYFSSAHLLPFFFLEFVSPSNLTVALILSTTIFFLPLFIASVIGGIAAPSTQAGLASIVFPLSAFLLFNLIATRNAHGFETGLLIDAGATCAIAALCLDVRRRWRRSKINRAKGEPEASTI